MIHAFIFMRVEEKMMKIWKRNKKILPFFCKNKNKHNEKQGTQFECKMIISLIKLI